MYIKPCQEHQKPRADVSTTMIYVIQTVVSKVLIFQD